MLKVLLLISSIAFSFAPSYLIEVSPLGNTSILLSWRNNSSSTKGVIVLRKYNDSLYYRFVDSVFSPTSIYTDTGLKGSTRYYYRVVAFSDSGLSDSSNTDSAITPASPNLIYQPVCRYYPGNYNANLKALRIDIYDCDTFQFNCRVYRSDNLNPYLQIASFPFTPGINCTTLSWIDTSVIFDHFYTYYVDAYTGSDTKASEPLPSPIFTNKPVSMKPNIILGSKIGSIPTYYGSWSVKSGDTILLNESNSPSGQSSIIDVHDLTNPTFIGYLPFNMNVLATRNNILLIKESGALVEYRMNNLEFEPINSNNLLITENYDSYFSAGKNIFIGRFTNGPSGAPFYRVYFILDTTLYSSTNINLYYPSVLNLFLSQFNNGSVIESYTDYVVCGRSCINQVQRYYLTTFSLDPFRPSIGSSESLQYSSPYQLDDFIVSDSIGQISKNIFIDTSRKAIFILAMNSLDIYGYSLDSTFIDNQNDPVACNINVYPNPFNPVASISYSLRAYSHVDIRLFTPQGQLISIIQKANLHAGQYKITLDANHHPSGLYLLKAIIGDYSFVKKLILIK